MSQDIDSVSARPPRTRRIYPKVLLLLPYIFLLWIPFYNDVQPALFGFPFFYWYQLLWVPVTSLLIFAAYKGGE